MKRAIITQKEHKNINFKLIMESRIQKPAAAAKTTSILDELFMKKRAGLAAHTELVDKIEELKAKKKMDEKVLELAKEKLKKAKNKRK